MNHLIASFHPLEKNGGQYAFYSRQSGQPPLLQANVDADLTRFSSASLIKIPILLAWVYLERSGQIHRAELCDLDSEPQVQGAGFSWLLRGRKIPYQDVLLMMIAISDNLCTNLVIQRIGLERLDQVFHQDLGLGATALQRKLMDYEARARGLDNWVTAADCIRFFDLLHNLRPDELAWVEPMLAANQDDLLLMRRIPRDTLTFYHKTGSIPGVLHDWGYTRDCDIFLITQNQPDEPAAFEVFGEMGRHFLLPPSL